MLSSCNGEHSDIGATCVWRSAEIALCNTVLCQSVSFNDDGRQRVNFLRVDVITGRCERYVDCRVRRRSTVRRKSGRRQRGRHQTDVDNVGAQRGAVDDYGEWCVSLNTCGQRGGPGDRR